MSALVEIERRFLIDGLPSEFHDIAGVLIRQGYLAFDGRREVRIRGKGADYYMAVKEGSGLVRREVGVGITRAQFEALWPCTLGYRIEKTRYELPLPGPGERVLELDVFHGALAPLCILEVEFSTVAESQAFVPPAFAGAEVTEREAYRNRSLATDGLPVDFPR